MEPLPPSPQTTTYGGSAYLNSEVGERVAPLVDQGEWSNNDRSTLQTTTPSPTTGHYEPSPQFPSWRFVPRPIRSLIHKKAILPRRDSNEPDLMDRSRDSSLNFFLRIKRNVFSSKKSKVPTLRETLNETPERSTTPVSWYENVSRNRSDYEDRNDHKDENLRENSGAEPELGHGAHTPPVDNHSQNDLPSAPTLIPHVLSSSEDDSPPHTDSCFSTSARCVTAELALVHAASKETELCDILAKFCCEGSYLIQTGFNQEMLDSNQGLLQEIYLFLQCEVNPLKAEKMAAILGPFPVTIYTPTTTYQYPPLQGTEDIWNLWRHRGIFCSDIRGQEMVKIIAPTDAGENSVKSTGSASGASNTGSSSGGESGNSRGGHGEHDRGGGDSNDSNSEGSRDRDDEDGHAGDFPSLTPKTYRDACSTREISIPFSSTLAVSGENYQPSTRYKTNASIDIRIEDNHESQSRPPGLTWGGPWVKATFTMLDAEMHVIPKGKLGYHLDLSQIRIMASGCLASVLSYSPTIIRADGDTIKSTTEKNNSAGLKATIGVAPTLRLEGAITQASSEERSQKRWEVIAHCLPSDRDDSTGNPRATMMWKYAHNARHYAPETRNTFDPKPSAIFGLSRTSSTMPKLDVEVVMDYSWLTPTQRFLDWITTLSKTKKAFPAFSNFLHQVSVTLDLTRVTERTEWVVGLNAEDRQKISDIGAEPRSTIRRLENNAGASACTVLLRQALHGHVSLTEEQRKEYKTDPLSLLSLATSWKGEADEMLALDSLPTPSPSPSPSPTSSEVDNKRN